MPSLFSFLLLLGATSAQTLEMNLKRHDPNPNPLGERRSNATLARRARLAFTSKSSLEGNLVELDVGTPPQRLNLRIDINSADTWVLTREVADQLSLFRDCSEPLECAVPYVPEMSSTYMPVQQDGSQQAYMTGSTTIGDWFADAVSIDGLTIRQQHLGLVYHPDVRSRGALGLGFSSNVATEAPYVSVLQNMVAQGAIKHPTYSLSWSPDGRQGKLILGGMDIAKMIDVFYHVPLYQDNRTNMTQYSVAVDGLAIGGHKRAIPAGSWASLDPNSPYVFAPPDVANDINARFGVVEFKCRNQDCVVDAVDCGLTGASVDLQFGRAVIRVPIEVLVRPGPHRWLTAATSELLKRHPNHPMSKWKQGVCGWNVMSSGSMPGASDADKVWSLGAPFLRSAYVVFGLPGKILGMAQAQFNSSLSTVVPYPYEPFDAVDFYIVP